MPKKVVAAMSGGVDSAVAAYLMKQQGFEVIGVTLRLAPDNIGGNSQRTGRCCSIDDMTDARQVCDRIGIPFYAVDAQAKFKETVFDPFVNAYQNGITPIPCLACNHTVKFGDLFNTAKNLNAFLATGHYAQVVDYNGIKTIAKPYDLDRDQTYYLYGTNPAIMSDLVFPLGKLTKTEVRKIARKIDLLVHDKKDSYEICFVPDGDHAAVVEKTLGKKFSGKIVDEKENILGTHQGVHKFTIGQRRGLGVSAKDRLFVADIDSSKQTVVLAKKDSLRCTKVEVSDFRYLVPAKMWPKNINVKIRARSSAQSASVNKILDEKNQIQFIFDEDVFSVALGQAAVVYDGETMLGGGILSGRLDGAFPRKITTNGN
jgi:tRNA-uridine 2-sulfurtransferase